MIKLKTLLLENSRHTWNPLSINDVQQRLDYYFRQDSWSNRSIFRSLELLEEYYHKDEQSKKWVEDYLTLLNEVGQQIISIVNKLDIPYVSVKYIKEMLLDREEYLTKVEDAFPFPIYVAGDVSLEEDPEQPMTIGIMVDANGKVLEIHEGNDEATPATIQMVNKILNPKGKAVRIYAAHGLSVVQNIEKTEYLPKGLYVSPSRDVAAGYMDLEGQRAMFTGIIDINDVNQESEIDWRTNDKTKIIRFRLL